METMRTILILGGYGVFGQRVAYGLSGQADIKLIIAGRDLQNAQDFANSIGADAVAFDVRRDLATELSILQPHIVINCCGPFQGQSYDIARACITQGCHYIDLADGRDYVAQFSSLDALAKANKVSAITGASSVPAISACVLDHFATHDFSSMQQLDYAITPGNQTERGVATVASILSYIGKPFTTLIDNRMQRVIGWRDQHRRTYPVFGRRWLGNCDVPDLALFPARYPSLHTIRFYAGLELPVLQGGVWLIAWLAQIRLVRSWAPSAAWLRRVSLWFYPFGSAVGGMHVQVTGLDKNDQPLTKTFYLIAGGGDGPQIPAAPASLAARRILTNPPEAGAYPCLGLFTLDELKTALEPFQIAIRFA